MRRLKILVSAYACLPERGSEPGVGWNLVVQVARFHDVWVVTRTENKELIEAELIKNPVSGLNFIYHDVPEILAKSKRWVSGEQICYYVWQLGIWGVLRKLESEVAFDLTHHVTYGKYWAPSLLSFLQIPFIWGVVGGGESAPKSFCKAFGFRERVFEAARSFARWMGEQDPLVRQTAQRCSVALAATDETAMRLRKLGAKNVHVLSQCALTETQWDYFSALPEKKAGPLRFISIGRPLHWKGFGLGLRAFALADLKDSEYWLLANGPGRERLEVLVSDLGIEDRVKFIGKLSSLQDVYGVMSECDALVHPALHEAFGNVVLEAMAAKKAVICLDIGGPAFQVVEGSGIKASALSPERAISDMAEGMMLLNDNRGLAFQMGRVGAKQVESDRAWPAYVQHLLAIYDGAARG